MLPTLVVSIFSMNVTIPLSPYPHAFWVITSIAAISSHSSAFYGGTGAGKRYSTAVTERKFLNAAGISCN